MKTIVGAVFARGGSKAVPNKNLRMLGGKSLVARSIECALALSRVERVYCSTDSEAIAQEAKRAGALIPFMRPDALATDDSSEFHAWQHLLSHLHSEEGNLPDAMVSLPPTSPLRRQEDVERAIATYCEEDVDLVVAVVPSSRSPWFNMVQTDHEGFLRVPMRFNGPTVTRRQDAPALWDLTTVVYVASSEYVMSADSLLEGRVRGIEISPESAVDIDTELDLKIAETLYEELGDWNQWS